MVDTKISGLAAATAAAATNEFVINEAGTSKKLTGTLLKAFTDPFPVIAGASGAVSNTIGARTLQVITANNADIPTTTPVTQLTATGVGAGWWLAEYWVGWQSNVTTTGITFIVSHSGTAANFKATRIDPLSSSTALATVGIFDQQPTTAVTGKLPSVWATRTNGGALGPNDGVVAINVDEMTCITALFLVTVSGDLLLRANSEVASTVTRVVAGTMAKYTRLS